MGKQISFLKTRVIGGELKSQFSSALSESTEKLMVEQAEILKELIKAMAIDLNCTEDEAEFILLGIATSEILKKGPLELIEKAEEKVSLILGK